MTEEQKQRALVARAESRRLLEEVTNMQQRYDNEPAAEDFEIEEPAVVRSAPWIDELLGPLGLTDPLERYRAEAEAQERRFAKERAAMKAEEQRVLRQRQQEAEPFTRLQIDAIGGALAEYPPAIARRDPGSDPKGTSGRCAPGTPGRARRDCRGIGLTPLDPPPPNLALAARTRRPRPSRHGAVRAAAGTLKRSVIRITGNMEFQGAQTYF